MKRALWAVCLFVPMAGLVARGAEEAFLANVYLDGRILGGVNGEVHVVLHDWTGDADNTATLRALLEQAGHGVMMLLSRTDPVGELRVGEGAEYPIAYARTFHDGKYRHVVVVIPERVPELMLVRKPRTVDYDLTFIELRVRDDGYGEGVVFVDAEMIADVQHAALSVRDPNRARVRLKNVRPDTDR